MGGEEKTEKATPKKRRDERKKGHVATSQDTSTVITLFGSIFMLRLLLGRIVDVMQSFLAYCLDLCSGRLVRGISDNILLQCIGVVVRTSGPLMGVTVLLAVVATMAQTRMMVAPEAMKPKFNKLNPIEGFKKLFSLKSVINALMGIAKIIVLIAFIYTSVRSVLDLSPRFLHAELVPACKALFSEIYSMMLKVASAFLVLAAIDFMYQRWQFEKDMKMTKQEVKEEYKQTEGDPQIKSRIRQVQREMSRSRMMQAVSQADVIIRNPTHVAVALRYHPETDEAPVVLAKGLDVLARRIVEAAAEHDIIVIENVPLARALYARAELDCPIPEDLYEAVAEVMVYLYKLGRIQG